MHNHSFQVAVLLLFVERDIVLPSYILHFHNNSFLKKHYAERLTFFDDSSMTLVQLLYQM